MLSKMIDTTEDFFDLDDFAEVVTFNGKSIKAMFDKQQVSIDSGFATVTGYSPQLTLQTSDVVSNNVDQGSVFLVRGQNYVATDLQDNGTGISTVTLQLK